MAFFSLFSSVRYDTKIRQVYENPEFKHAGWNYLNKSACYMLDFHRDRILRAAQYWQWTAAVDVLSKPEALTQIESSIQTFLGTEAEKGAFRTRILVNEQGELNFEQVSEEDRPLESLFPAGLPPPSEDSTSKCSPIFKIVLDDVETAKSAYTHYKTTKREMYDGARQRAGIHVGDAKEVLLVNDADGSIMEGSVTTPYFWRGGRWVTPPVSTRFATEGSGGQDGTTRRWSLENGFAVEEVVFASDLVDGEPIWVSNGAKGFMFGVFQKSSA